MTLAEAMILLRERKRRYLMTLGQESELTMLPEQNEGPEVLTLKQTTVEYELLLRGPMVPTTGRISSPFGRRMHPVLHRMKMHNGVDIAAPRGTPVVCPLSGTVTHAGPRGAFGLAVYIDHYDGRQSILAHMSAVHVHVGEEVERGDVVGAVGATGRATGPHLHWEFHLRGTAVDPLAA